MRSRASYVSKEAQLAPASRHAGTLDNSHEANLTADQSHELKERQ